MVPTDLCIDVVLVFVLKYYLNYVSSILEVLTDTSCQTSRDKTGKTVKAVLM